MSARRWAIAVALLASACAHGPGTHEVVRAGPDDSLVELARLHALGYGEIMAANPGVDPWLPGEDTEVVLPTRHLPPREAADGIVVNLATQRLWLFDASDRSARSYPIGIGRPGWRIPIGKTAVKSKQLAPTWYPPTSARREDRSLPESIGPGPDNPLGTHAIYLEWPRYLIHGTNEPYGVGRRVSRGCIRLYPEHIVELYDRTRIGLPVRVVNDPVQVGWRRDELYMEVHPPVSQRIEQLPPQAMPKLDPELEQRLREIAAGSAERVQWDVVERTLAERRGVPVQITTPEPRFLDAFFGR